MTYDTLSFNLKVDVVTRCHFRGIKLLPKQTFFNLPKDKKDHLLYAVEKEFSRVPLYEASISNIVKTADIPRGSFYQYFEDKEDAYFYLLNEQVEAKKNQFLKCLQEHDGNVFDAVIQVFELALEGNPNDQELLFLKNAFLNMTHEIESKLNRIFNVDGSIDKIEEIDALIDKNNLNIKNDVELHHVMQIISMVIFRNLIEKYAHNLTYEQAIENFKIQINLLKNGLGKHTNVNN